MDHGSIGHVRRVQLFHDQSDDIGIAERTRSAQYPHGVLSADRALVTKGESNIKDRSLKLDRDLLRDRLLHPGIRFCSRFVVAGNLEVELAPRQGSQLRGSRLELDGACWSHSLALKLP